MSTALLWTLTLLNTVAVGALLLRMGDILQRSARTGGMAGPPVAEAASSVDRMRAGLPVAPHDLSVLFLTDECEGCSRALGELQHSDLADVLLVDLSGRSRSDHDRFRARVDARFSWLHPSPEQKQLMIQEARVRATPTYLVLRGNEVIRGGLCEDRAWIAAMSARV
ncbi:hypothetical protein BJY16_005356 [Actinoplanes octamycinicus]|uniref:Thioredoxin-like protein n=1 Tax=Actinoplanes octamycinicus TaxID=135948 RepID=A0A7W7H105_9ACTN|nr:hypothetical protein [Actinoplanes octamycinicus]MBB4741897.1 hypothetical protein [Actinoplanes octamycinicus]GIE60660.1 hypothetical protein Aoc01nite_60620 [Actinoplanes octamycinicus]